jgi:perosamine synthetase
MWSRLRFDISWCDLCSGVAACFFQFKRDRLQTECEHIWAKPDEVLVCSSVRSGFDLLLTALKLPTGSEVLLSALTVPDMPRIVRQHGLVPIPIDLSVDGFSPCIDSLERAVTSNSRVLVVAHLFGAKVDLSPIVAIAKHYKLLLVEDCAQSFSRSSFHAVGDVDVSMYSFGPIKTATALGGGVLRVRDGNALGRMRELQSNYRTQSRTTYGWRIAKYGVLKALANRRVLGMLAHLVRLSRLNADRLVGNLARNYATRRLLKQLRRKPSAPLLAMLRRRWQRYDWQRLETRETKSRYLQKAISGADCTAQTKPGVAEHTHWVFPVFSDDRDLVRDLRRAGFDATSECRLSVVREPEDREGLTPINVLNTMSKLVFVPFYPELPERELTRLASILNGRACLLPEPTPAEDP